MIPGGTKWISEHSEEVFKYEGLYIGIVDGKIVASAKTSAEVIQQVPDANPVIMLVPRKGLSF